VYLLQNKSNLVLVFPIETHYYFQIAKDKPPIVGFIPFAPAPWLKVYIGGPSYPTVRSYTHAAIAKPVGLWQRTWNVLYYTVDELV